MPEPLQPSMLKRGPPQPQTGGSEPSPSPNPAAVPVPPAPPQTPNSSTAPPAKRPKLPRRPDASRPDATATWLRHASAEFVRGAPPLHWTGGFYSWGTWLEGLSARALWGPAGPWRTLVAACKAAGAIRGAAALYRAKNELVSAIINEVYRASEAARVHAAGKPAERDVIRRVRAVITRQRKHEPGVLTLIRFLDFAFVLSAYVDCCVATAPSVQAEEHVRAQIDSELDILQEKPNAKVLHYTAVLMEEHMREQTWLPWYDEIPGVRNSIVIRAREAAISFCKDLPCLPLNISPSTTRGPQREHLASSESMDNWLVSLLDPTLDNRWEALSDMYSMVSADGRGEEKTVLEVASKRVVEKALKPALESGDDPQEHAQSKLVDAIPGIVVTQSLISPGRLTFRQLLELYIYLSNFRKYLVNAFNRKQLPVLKEIHNGVVLFAELSDRISDIRAVILQSHHESFIKWCLIAVTHLRGEGVEKTNEEACFNYLKAAIGAALGRVFLRFDLKPFYIKHTVQDLAKADPLTCASIVAEWDPMLASRVIDAAVRINDATRAKFAAGYGDGLDLYVHRRIIVCDAARELCDGDSKAAGKIMAKLYPVWDAFEDDKNVGRIDRRGVETMCAAVERGNFEAATFYGLLLSSPAWAAQREACLLQQDIEQGVRLILQAFETGDAAAAIDLSDLLLSPSPSAPLSKGLIEEMVQSLHRESLYHSLPSLFTGFLLSVGAPGLAPDCAAAARCYERVLDMEDVPAACRGHAANNLGVLMSVGQKSALRQGGVAAHYLQLAVVCGNEKAKTTYAAMLGTGVAGIARDPPMSQKLYFDFFLSTGGLSPVCVLQKDDERKLLYVYEMYVQNEKQKEFCEAVEKNSVPLDSFGRVLRREALPYAALH